jgi:hypothetical protein
MTSPTERDIEKLAAIIYELHGAKASHRESVPVKEVFEGRTMWDGVVEVFDLHGHPETHRVYAWSHKTDSDEDRHVTVLHIPPVVDPVTAVRAAIIQEFQNAQSA